MNVALISLETLKILYEREYIKPEALAAIAPITWLARHYPELLKHPETALRAMVSDRPTSYGKQATTIARKPLTCKTCIYFSSVHSCCMTRVDNESTYLAVTNQSAACQDFERVELPSFVNRGQQ